MIERIDRLNVTDKIFSVISELGDHGDLQFVHHDRAWLMHKLTSWPVCLATLIGLTCGPSELFAEPPTLTSLIPTGGQRGTRVVVNCAGTFTWPPHVSAPGLEVTPAADQGRLEVTIPADMAADRAWIRLYNADGTSVPLPFLIGNLPEIAETEPNDKFREPQSVSSTVVTINGHLKDVDVDCFAVELAANQTLVAAVDANTRLGSPMDSVLQIVSPDGIVLAENHDDLNLDPRLAFTPAKPGTYIVRIFAFPSTPGQAIRFNGSPTHLYRLTLTTGPYVTHPVPLAASAQQPAPASVVGWNLPSDSKLNILPYPTDQLNENAEFELLSDLRRYSDAKTGFIWAPQFAGHSRIRLEPPAIQKILVRPDSPDSVSIQMGTAITACLKNRKQVDEYRLPLTKGQQVILTAETRSLGTQLDSVLKLIDPAGGVVAESDDVGAARDSIIAHTAAHDGEYRITVRDRFQRGSDRYWYLLTARLEEADFELSASAESVSVTTGTPTEVAVKILRRGTASEAVGPITVQAVNLPAGVTCAAVVSEPSGPTAAEVKLSLTSTGPAFSGPIRISGKATAPKEFERFARTPVRLDACFETIWLTVIEKK